MDDGAGSRAARGLGQQWRKCRVDKRIGCRWWKSLGELRRLTGAGTKGAFPQPILVTKVVATRRSGLPRLDRDHRSCPTAKPSWQPLLRHSCPLGESNHACYHPTRTRLAAEPPTL